MWPPPLIPFWSRGCQNSRYFVPKYRYDLNESTKNVLNALCGCTGFSSIRRYKLHDERVGEAVWRTFGVWIVVLWKLTHLLWGNMLMKVQIFMLTTYYDTRLYHRVKEGFHTEFPNSSTTLSDSLILRLVRKFEGAGSIQDKLRKGKLQCVEKVRELVAQNPHTLITQLAARVKTSFCTVFWVSLAQLMPHPVRYL